MQENQKKEGEDVKSLELKKLEQLVRSAKLSPAQLRNVADRIRKPHHTIPHHLYEFSNQSTTVLLVGDLHLNAKDPNNNSKKCDFKRFNEVLRIGKEEGAEYVIQTGDVTDGEEMRKDQKYGLVVQGADNVIDYCVNEWPDCGLPTFFIAGNHDQSYDKLAGLDICKHIAMQRKDLIYLGMNEGNIPLQAKFHEAYLTDSKEFLKKPPVGVTWVRIRHPSKGTAKSQSYQIQEHIGSMQSSFKPQMLVVGHYHKIDYLFDRNVHAFQAGTMEKQSDWMRTKDIAAHLGAWLVTVYYKPTGEIDRLKKRKLLYKVNGTEKWGKQMEMGVYEGE